MFTRHLNMECFELTVPAKFVSYAPTFFYMIGIGKCKLILPRSLTCCTKVWLYICIETILFLFDERFLSERETADRNFALAYYMRENKVFLFDDHQHEK